MGKPDEWDEAKGTGIVGEGSKGAGKHCAGGFDPKLQYLIPCELCGELPVEQIVLVQAETFVDQRVLRGKG